MGIIRWISRRSKWLAKRLWIVMVADVLLTTRRHWKRLDADEQSRVFDLAWKAKGRPKQNLSARERRELSALLDKAGHIEYAGNVAGIVLPFAPLSRLTAKFLTGRRTRAQKRALKEGTGA